MKMMNNNDLMSRINAQYNGMSRGQKRIANYITDYYDQAVFLTAAKLGEAVGVSESTVVRFAMSLGYKGYPQFQKDLEDNIRGRLIEQQTIQIKNDRAEQDDILRTTLESDIKNLKNTLEDLDNSAFQLAVNMILDARKIYIVGIRSCGSLATALAAQLNLVKEEVVLVNSSDTNDIFEQILYITDQDVMVGISFPRYSMRTLKAMEFANSRSAKVIALSDSIHSPINLYSSCNLIAHSDLSSVSESLTAPLSVINALGVACTKAKRKELAQNLKELENLWGDFDGSGNDEIEPITDSVQMFYPSEEEM